MNKVILFILLTLSSATSQAVVLTDDENKAIDFFISSIPLVKNQEPEFQKGQSIQKNYFTIEESLEFNKAILPFYTKNIEKENFKGFNPQEELVFLIPPLNDIYQSFLSSANPITRFKLESSYKENFYNIANTFNPLFFNDKLYYSETPVIGSSDYNFKENSKTIFFSKLNKDLPAVYFECYPDGEMIGIFHGKYFLNKDTPVRSFVSKTPIILQVPEEIKKHFTHYSSNFNPKKPVKNMCSYKRSFSDLNAGENFINLIDNPANLFISYFTIDKATDSAPYLTGKIKQFGFFDIDFSDYYYTPSFTLNGSTYKNNINEIIENKVNVIEKDKTYNNKFLNSEHSYVLNDFLFKAVSDDKILLTKKNSRLLIEYNYTQKAEEIIITLNKITQEDTTNFPLKIRIFQEPNEPIYNLKAYILYSDTPYTYTEENLNLRQSFFYDWNK